jgi:hypothetical protein
MKMSSQLKDTFIDDPSESRIYQTSCGTLGQGQHWVLLRARETHELQRPDHILPFLSKGIDNSVARMVVEQAIEDVSLDRSVESISLRLGSTSPELGFFLRSNPEVTANLAYVLDYLEDSLKTSGVSYDLTGDVWQDLEAPNYKVLEVVAKVNVADYEEILRLWRTADEKIYENMNISIRKRIVVLFERS